MSAAPALLAAVLGLLVGRAVDTAAASYPWAPRARFRRGGDDAQPRPGAAPSQRRGRGRTTVVALATAALFVLATLRFGVSAELPAFLYLAAVAMLLAVIDLAHHLLPDRVVLPSLGIAAVLLAAAALPDGHWTALLRAVLGAALLFLAFLVLALIAPRGLGFGDVKLAALVGLYLGWLGWGAVLLGAVAGFVVQAALALVLLAARRIDLRGELPFGPAMLLGAALAIGWPAALTGTATLLH